MNEEPNIRYHRTDCLGEAVEITRNTYYCRDCSSLLNFYETISEQQMLTRLQPILPFPRWPIKDPREEKEDDRTRE